MMERDKRWSMFEGMAKDFDIYAERAGADMFLKPEVSDDIHQSFRVIKRLLQCSFYEYEFYDIAAFQSLIALEMAFRIRYKEIEGKDCPKKMSLQELFDMFFEKGYLEIYDKFFIDHIRNVRNSMTHRKTHGFSGPNSRQWVHHSIDLVNDLYENVDLRKERIDKTRELNNILQDFSKKGCIVTHEVNKTFFVYDLSILFYDNKSVVKNISICYMPIFEIPENDTKLGYPPFLILDVEDYLFSNGLLYGIVNEKVSFVIEPTVDPVNRENFDKWLENYEVFNNRHMCDVMIRSQIGDLYNDKRRAFHKQ